MNDIIVELYTDKFNKIFAGEDPNLVFNRRDIDKNGNMIKVPVDKKFLLRAAKAVFGETSKIVKKVEKFVL